MDFSLFLHECRSVLLSRMPSAENVLSAGSAGEWYFEWFDRLYPHRIKMHLGIDLNPCPDKLPENVTWMQRDASDLTPINSRSVDLVFAGQFIEQIGWEQQVRFLAEVNRVLVEGGFFVLDSPNYAVTNRYGWKNPEHVHELTFEQMYELLELAGFEVLNAYGILPTNLLGAPPEIDGTVLKTGMQFPDLSLEDVKTAITDNPRDAFIWWIVARKRSEAFDRMRLWSRLGEFHRLNESQKTQIMPTSTAPSQGSSATVLASVDFTPQFISPIGVTSVDSPWTRIPILGSIWRTLRRPVHSLVVFYLNQFINAYNQHQRRIYQHLYALNERMTSYEVPQKTLSSVGVSQDGIQSSPLAGRVGEVFEIVYGRTPTQSEMDYLASSQIIQDCDTPAGLFRKVINAYDHQLLSTPFTVRFSAEDVEYVSVGGVEIAIDKADISVGLPLKRGIYEPHLIKFYRQRLKSGMIFIDIGANIGIYSLLAARLVGPKGHVFCFEPNSENCRLILLSAARNNFQNLSVRPFALGNKVGYFLFSTFLGSNGGLIPDSQESLLNPSCMVLPMFRLDDVIDSKVDFIKVDVEGAEGLVIEGANRIIDTYRPIITSEFSMEMLPRVSGITGEDYLRYFDDKGYKIFLIEQRSQELIPITDISAFIHSYGEPTRIEDLAFFPDKL